MRRHAGHFSWHGNVGAYQHLDGLDSTRQQDVTTKVYKHGVAQVLGNCFFSLSLRFMSGRIDVIGV